MIQDAAIIFATGLTTTVLRSACIGICVAVNFYLK